MVPAPRHEDDESRGGGGRHGRPLLTAGTDGDVAPTATGRRPRAGRPTAGRGGRDEAAEQATDAERGHGVTEHVEGERPDVCASGPGPTVPPDSAGRDREEHPRQHPAGAAAHGALVPAQGRRAAQRAGAGESSDEGRHNQLPGAPGRRREPSTGSAASSGKSGSGPITTAAGETTLWAPTAKPGPSRKDPVNATAFGTTEVLRASEEQGWSHRGARVQLGEHHGGGAGQVGRQRDQEDHEPGARARNVTRMRRLVTAAERSVAGR